MEATAYKRSSSFAKARTITPTVLKEVKSLHRQSMSLAEQAIIERAKGEWDHARILAQEAFSIEFLAANIISEYDSEPDRSVLHRSAATLAIECGRFVDAVQLIRRGLRGQPPAEIAQELEEILETVPKSVLLEIPTEEESGAGRQPVVNDFSIQVATVNGSGSQSANTVLLRTIFQMGVPVSGKNLFPSNIAGLPTWYTIRASKKGYIARKKEIDFLVAMNPETAKEDVLSLAPGAVALYDEPLKLNELRTDLTFYAVPYDKITAAVCPESKLRKLVRNMVYVGVVAKLLNLDMAEVEKALRKQFAKKKKAADLNWSAAQAGYDYAASSLTKADPFTVERMDKTSGMIIIDGNAAAALGCMFAGVTVVTWYPITPSSSLVESLIDYMKEHRIGPDGKATFAIVQAEDELAAIGMVLGAGWSGARSMTATAGPGISLMAEFAGLGYYVEIPGVIWDIQRVGPSTGLPTRTSQGDIGFVASLSHGDTKHPMLIPSSVQRVLLDGERSLQSHRAVADAGVRDERSRPRHEQLDVGAVRISQRRRSIAARCCRRKTSTGWEASPATKTLTATASAIARCREPSIRRRHGLRAAADTTRRRNTASVPTIT